jgi:hypothetical protein
MERKPKDPAMRILMQRVEELSGTQFTCFTCFTASTKVQALTPEERRYQAFFF